MIVSTSHVSLLIMLKKTKLSSLKGKFEMSTVRCRLITCPANQSSSRPSPCFTDRVRWGITRGRRHRYHRKYWKQKRVRPCKSAVTAGFNIFTYTPGQKVRRPWFCCYAPFSFTYFLGTYWWYQIVAVQMLNFTLRVIKKFRVFVNIKIIFLSHRREFWMKQCLRKKKKFRYLKIKVKSMSINF